MASGGHVDADVEVVADTPDDPDPMAAAMKARGIESKEELSTERAEEAAGEADQRPDVDHLPIVEWDFHSHVCRLTWDFCTHQCENPTTLCSLGQRCLFSELECASFTT